MWFMYLFNGLSRLYPGIRSVVTLPGLHHFISKKASKQISLRRTPENLHPYLTESMLSGEGKKVYFDVYGCQMNVNDADVVWSILQSYGYVRTVIPSDADIRLILTCSIREGAEQKIWNKLISIRGVAKGRKNSKTKICLLGCMAERLKHRLLEEDFLVDVVAGPDAYKDLPRLLAFCYTSNQSAINVLLSHDETYADISPMRLNENKVTGFVSIQRGCDNMCTYCIVPFTRGKERSRPIKSILSEVRNLWLSGVREITLLGQNVNSYRDISSSSGDDSSKTILSNDGFKSIYKSKVGGIRFAELLSAVADINPELRVRFVSPHPKDFPLEVLQVISERDNICKQLHLPAQSGSSRVLGLMRRGYSREAYLELVENVRNIIPQVSLSSDFIAGFCGETEQDFEQTLSLIMEVKYSKLFLFPYSMREQTFAHRKLKHDDIANEIKVRRCNEMIQLYRSEAHKINQKMIGSRQLVLIEGESKRSSDYFQGRTDGNHKVIFDKSDVVTDLNPGDYCSVLIESANSEVLKGKTLVKTSVQEYYS